MFTIKQTHTVNIVFRGNFEQFLGLLEHKGIDFEFVAPGLSNSNGVLEIKGVKEKEEWQDPPESGEYF